MSQPIYLFGIHAIESLLHAEPDRILHLSVLKDRQDKKIRLLIKLAEDQGLTVEYVNRQTLDRLTQAGNHQGIAAVVKKARILTETDLPMLLQSIIGHPLLLILDGVQDPHNLGACMRTADAAGAHAVIVPKDKSAGLTPVVSKVASGAAETLPFVQVTNLARTLSILKELGIWIYGAALEADKTLYQVDFSGPIALVLGAEGGGLRRLTREHCDGLMKIPMLGRVSSLNVSVATGVCLFEAVRQRDSK